MLNVEMYTQMGYTKAQVIKAHEYSQKKNVDMFDALQVLQSQDRFQSGANLQREVPPFSYLVNMKGLKLNEYQVLYSKHAVKNPQMGKEQIRQLNNPVGLLNVSNCCYLNSLLQCYFLMGEMTREILQAQPIPNLPEAPESRVKNKRIENEYKLLGALQQIFAKMKLSSKKYLDPTPVLKNMVDSVGQKIEYGDEKDLHEINMCIVERLSECLMYTRKYYSSSDDSPSKARKNQNIKKLFYGTKVEYTEGSEEAMQIDFLGLILNPKDHSLLTAIDSQFNYYVQIEGKQKKKQTYIKNLPQYLFININRTGYEKSANQFVKNEEKISFDFVIYLDRYLDKNKQQSRLVNPKIIQLLKNKNTINHQINHLQLLTTKLNQCRMHAKYLSGWSNRLPEPESLQKQKLGYLKQIDNIEKQLIQIESRKQKFVLMYLFVHRGDAISGHYWGYGRNGNNWYRFDINCARIKQSEILIDMQRSGGTPYAMVYVKDDKIQSFAYPYYLNQPNQQLLDIGHHHSDYIESIPVNLRTRIIDENVLIHKVIDKERNKNIIQGIVQDYKIKYNIVVSQGQQFEASQPRISNYANFSLYLYSIGQIHFMKYHLYQMALYDKTQMTPKELLENDKLLKSIQKSFRKKMKNKMVLRHYAIECEPEQGKKYSECYKQYKIGRICVKFIQQVHKNMKNWPKSKEIRLLIEEITPLIVESGNSIYIKSLTRELVAIMILDLAIHKEGVRKNWAEASQNKNPFLLQQLKQLNVEFSNEQLAKSNLLQVEEQKVWKLEDLKKNEHEKVTQKIQQVIKKMQKGLDIYTKNLKQKEVVKINAPEDLI